MPVVYQPPSPVPLIPVASPVDTYSTQPVVEQRPINNNLKDLAAGLSTLDAGLRDFMQARQAKEKEEDQVRGAAAFYQNNGQGLAEAVASGAIPAQASPHFIAGYKKAQGSVAGFELQTSFSAAYDKSGIAQSDDPQAFTKFAQGFLKDNLGKSQDPAVLKGLLPHINSIMNNGMERYNADRHKALTKGVLDMAAAETIQATESASKQALVTGKPVDYAVLTAEILRIRAEKLARGIPGGAKVYDDQLIDAVVTQAVASRDPKLLTTFMDTTIPGTNGTFGQTLHGLKVREHAMEKMDTMYRRSVADQKALDTAADKKAKDALTVSIIGDIVKNGPNAPVDEAKLTALEKYDANARLDIIEWQRKVVKGETESNPTAVLQLHSAIINGGGMEVIKEAMRGPDPVIKGPVALDKAFSLFNTVEKSGPAGAAIIKLEAARTARASIAGQFRVAAGLNAQLMGIEGTSLAGLDAMSTFDIELIRWASDPANANAGPAAQSKFITDTARAVMEGAEKPKFGKERGFNEPPALTAPTPPAVEPGKAATAPLPPVDLKAWASDPKNLTPEQLERVTEAAKREGVSLESKLKFLYENQPKGKVFVKPLSTEADPVKPKGTAFELAFGDSIAAQQVRHGVPGTEGPMGGTSLLPTAVVGDSPQKVLRRMQAQDGASVSGKTMFLSTGASNDPSQVELVGNQLDYLKANGVGAVVVPGVGPGVKDSAAVNAKLKALTEARGFTYFAPPADSWQKDGIHPRAAVAFGKLALASIPQATPVSGNGGEDLTADVRKLLTDTLSKAPSSSGGSKIDMSDIEAVLRRSVRRAPSAKLMGTFTASVLKDNPAAAALLDFVARPESGGNYNAVIGNGASTQDLSKMSLGEVMALQKALVAQGRESGAIGRYQIINQTLRGLVSELGLSTSEKFTPELQDRLGFALLERRGYSAWKAGQLSDVQFAHNLALEWAAIPSPKTGLSAYQGVGSNRAGVAMHSVFSTLRDLFPRK